MVVHPAKGVQGVRFIKVIKKTSDIIWQDSQHQTLFRLIDQLREHEVDPDVFVSLHRYAENHFSLEEEYMVEISYPYAREHIAAHNKFRKELKTMYEQHRDYDEELRQALSLFLREWLMRHVMGIDKKLEEFILASDVK